MASVAGKAKLVAKAGRETRAKPVNGEGNLVIGYDEAAGVPTGSHNLILGAEQTFTSYAGIDAGLSNTIGAPMRRSPAGKPTSIFTARRVPAGRPSVNGFELYRSGGPRTAQER